MTDHVTPDLHLQIEVIVKTPAAERLYRLFPFHPVGGIEQTSLAEGMHQSSMGEIVEHTILGQTGELTALSLQFTGQTLSLRTVDDACGRTQVVEIWFEGLVVLLVVVTEDGNIRTNLCLMHRSQHNPRQWTVIQHVLEIILRLCDSCVGVPVQMKAH